ncbi:ANTAR domain-containing protein [Pseudokineococcus basanitobsidens]|uniref:ANTAR domain-containing protein n=1 Tax=Pseudokineococcus basanitobsidens TaxID=1926649 RepID=A0ABU8RN83_9ACTN
MTDVDPEALRAGLSRLQELDGSPALGSSAADSLAEVLSALSSALPLASAGLMLRDAGGRLACVAWTGSASRTLEEAEDEVVSGPATDAQVLGSPRATSDVLVDPRWPSLGPALRADGAGRDVGSEGDVLRRDSGRGPDGSTPAPRGGAPRAVATVPVAVAGGPVGCLVAVREETGEWSPAQLEVLESSARLAAGLLRTAAAAEGSSRLAEQLQHALDHRVVVERAVGYLMAQRQVDATDAFGELRRASRSARRKVAEVAEQVLALGGLEAAAEAARAPSA